MASDMHILAVSLIKQGEKSTREINQETGYAIKYLEQLKSELKHPGAIKRARDRYNARHPGLTVARTREWRSQHPSERNRRRRENYRVTANARNDHQTWLPIHLEKITCATGW